ncbi:thiosulfate oxidation carrier complex protein SoxZ [Sulfuricurvum sp.]|jgi:sulfur-oxidizing protein SoxZ|uniref:thiosulfate oxidation carrier complex protein SoxZ n=1 Tax=Sulfuricurvum sp. TaxID=2025608 RepID=UPI00286E99FF|nr:thiosulfate oxidation carrier complex protein SoxZ [Sulfuricurvum sp.]
MAEMKTLIKIKPKTYAAGDIVKIDFMAMHPMETGMRKNKDTGALIPAEYIDEVKFMFNDTLVTKMVIWESLSVNPLMSISFKVPGAGTLKVIAKDNKGQSVESTTQITPKG